ncbi:HEAT repeat domain-containing protein [Thalassoglobus sp. JC818]|uniref:HEAT repeat domain-containing protein n=1 Tax=Thalassoglobus sp. JC818 TaxID=3232136 RepID=UPI003458AF2A
MQASDSELQTVFNALRASANPNVLSRLLRVFSNRPLPEFDSHLIDLCQHSDSAVRSAAIAALSMNRNSFIRNFAAEQLSKGSFDVAIKQFVNNFEVGDESRILKALKFTEGKYEQHSTLMDITKVLEANSHADCSKLALIAYFETPCQLCRSSAARLLRQQNAAPNWLIDEIAFDAEEQCVNLFSDQDSKIIE